MCGLGEIRAIYLIPLECWGAVWKVSKAELGDQAPVGCKEGTPVERTFQSRDHLALREPADTESPDGGCALRSEQQP